MLGIDTKNWTMAGLFDTINTGIAGVANSATAILTAKGNLQAIRNKNDIARFDTQTAALNNQLIQAQIAQTINADNTIVPNNQSALSGTVLMIGAALVAAMFFMRRA